MVDDIVGGFVFLPERLNMLRFLLDERSVPICLPFPEQEWHAVFKDEGDRKDVLQWLQFRHI